MLFFSCLEQVETTNNADIEKARNWFDQNKHILSKVPDDPSVRGSSFFQKTPNWNKSKVHISKSGLKSIEVSLDYETFLIPSETELKSSKVNSLLNVAI